MANRNPPKPAPPPEVNHNGSSFFTHFAKGTALATGKPGAFITAAFVILVWGITGPIFHFSDTWQLVINTGTTIVTFLMVFLIQATQNRDSAAIHVKLDELIRAVHGARNCLIDLDELTDEELARIQKHYSALAHKSKDELRELKENSVTVAEATHEA
jgi:low affinity Fe/Cu permease